jgi:hypothetical protein
LGLRKTWGLIIIEYLNVRRIYDSSKSAFQKFWEKA